MASRRYAVEDGMEQHTDYCGNETIADAIMCKRSRYEKGSKHYTHAYKLILAALDAKDKQISDYVSASRIKNGSAVFVPFDFGNGHLEPVSATVICVTPHKIGVTTNIDSQMKFYAHGSYSVDETKVIRKPDSDVLKKLRSWCDKLKHQIKKVLGL
jgi:hypothetical protein